VVPPSPVRPPFRPGKGRSRRATPAPALRRTAGGPPHAQHADPRRQPPGHRLRLHPQRPVRHGRLQLAQALGHGQPAAPVAVVRRPRQYDPSTNTITVRMDCPPFLSTYPPGRIIYDSLIARSPDRKVLAVEEENLSPVTPWFTYDATTDAFSATTTSEGLYGFHS